MLYISPTLFLQKRFLYFILRTELLFHWCLPEHVCKYVNILAELAEAKFTISCIFFLLLKISDCAESQDKVATS